MSRPRHRAHLSARSVISSVAAVSLIAAGGVLVTSQSALAADGEITGLVYRDFLSDGVFDDGGADDTPTDRGLAGVTVTAYDASGAEVGTAVSGADGEYTLTVSGAVDEALRVELTQLPAGYESSYHGADSGTSVQFVEIGDEDVDYAVNAPEDYSQGSQAPVITPIAYGGLLSKSTPADKFPSLVASPWGVATNRGGEYEERTTLANYTDTGVLWGTAFQRSTGTVFAAASLHRQADIGPMGLGGIYSVPDALSANGEISSTQGAVQQWLDVQGLPIQGGGTVDVGADTVDWAARGLDGPDTPVHDPEVYDKVGTVGIGAITVSSDDKTLYFVNLFDRNLYAVDIADPTSARKISLGLSAGEAPWAVTVHRGNVYVGSVETGLGAGNVVADDLSFQVKASPESDLSSLATSASVVLTDSLGYLRGTATTGGAADRFHYWHAWTTAADWDYDEYDISGWGSSWGQAILSGLAFSDSGDLVLGFLDRYSIQAGSRNYGPLANAPRGNDTPEAVGAGDLLLASANADGTFTLESDGTAGGLTAAGQTGDDQGPGGKEFFDDANGVDGANKTHHETTIGGLATLPGFDEVASNGFDQTGTLRTEGIGWFSTVDGSHPRGYQVTDDGQQGTFEKAGGLGDLQALANAAPVEIGNRVWFDADHDGIQDAGEAPLPGVTVTLSDAVGDPVEDADGNVLEAVTTDAEGNYYFSNLVPNSTYHLQFEYGTVSDETFVSLGVDRTRLEWTTQGDDAADARTIDSNVGSDGSATVSVGGPGENDHTIDAGLSVPAVILYAVGDYVWFDTDKDGVQDDGEQPVPAVTVTLLDATGEPVDGVAPATTDENGFYVFDSLPAGDYSVKFVAPSGLPADTAFTVQGSSADGATEASDSNPDTATGVTVVFTLGPDAANQRPTTADDGLVAGYVNPTIDAGVVLAPRYAVGDHVWLDGDRDGVQDSGEAPVAGATVTLLDADGEPVAGVAPTTTDASGFYVFDNLPAGDYQVQFALPAGLPTGTAFTGSSTDGSTPANDSNPDVTTGRTPVFSLGEDTPDMRPTVESEGLVAATINPTIDAGVVVPSFSVGNYVWFDADKDGVQDETEAPVSGARITLLDADGNPAKGLDGEVVPAVLTDMNGYYVFDQLAAGQYTITFEIPSGQPDGTVFTTIDSADATDANDSDTNPTTGKTAVFTLGVGEPGTRASQLGDPGVTADFHNPTIDAGIVRGPEKVSVGDYVWLDANEDGLQGDDEDGIPGVVLEITGPDGNPVTDVDGNVVGPVTTDANGAYVFERLPSLEVGQTYTVRIDQVDSAEALVGLVPTLQSAGDDTADDSSTNSAVSAGDLTEDLAEDRTLDFGFVPAPRVTVGDYVWVDTNRDGLQDDGEPGIPGVTLTVSGPDGNPVTDVNGQPVGPVLTAADGSYLFANLPVLPAGEAYTVSIDKTASAGALAPYIATVENAGEETADDSSTDAATSAADLSADGAEDRTLDFGFVEPRVSVGDFVWVDTDRDGVQDDGELGIPGVTLTITDPDGNAVTDVFGAPVGPVVTDEDGQYVFPNLPALPNGTGYTVTIDKDASSEALAPYIPTLEGAGDETASDSSTDAATTTANLSADGTEDSALDFGFVKPQVSVGDFVWFDADRDGIQDEGEPGIPGVTLTIGAADVDGNPIAPVVTDKDGRYEFTGLPTTPDGRPYIVGIDLEASADVLAPYVPTRNDGTPDKALDSSEEISESIGDLSTNGAHDPTLDFGFMQGSVSVGDRVWADTDRDGIQDEGELSIPGVVLVITGPDGKPVTDVYGKPVGPQVTGKESGYDSGSYDFIDLPTLPKGQHYTVTIDKEASKEALAPYVPTVSGAGDPSRDSSDWTATSGDLIHDGEWDNTLDFGFVKPEVSVGDVVWVDTDGDGIQDKGEPGIPGVVLVITDADGNQATDIDGNPVGSVTTDENGHYVFEHLPPGQYTVWIDKDASKEALAPYAPTLGSAGGRDVDSSTGSAQSLVLLNGDVDSTLDFGFVPVPVVGGDGDSDTDGELPVTGAGLGAAGLGGLVILAGLAFVLIGRRRTI